MNESAISRAIKVLAMQCAGQQLQCLVEAVDVQADRLELTASASPAHPHIGSFGGGSRGGNSTPDSALVAGIFDCLTLDAQREKAGNSHYINQARDDVAALVRTPWIRELFCAQLRMWTWPGKTRALPYVRQDFPCSCIVGPGVYCYRHHRAAQVGDVAVTATPAPAGCSWPGCGCYSPQGPQCCRRAEGCA